MAARLWSGFVLQLAISVHSQPNPISFPPRDQFPGQAVPLAHPQHPNRSATQPMPYHGYNLAPTIFTVMTLNAYQGGANVNDGIGKLTKHIAAVNPHVVALQETPVDVADEICNRLNSRGADNTFWRRCQYSVGLALIITRLPITANYPAAERLKNCGCRLQLRPVPPTYVDVWSVHLQWRNYGPYTACDPSVSKLHLEETLFQNEHGFDGRFQNMLDLIKHDSFGGRLFYNPTPIVLAGDFNAPSHFDWTEDTKSFHCNVSCKWPVSQLMEAFGFQDSFRYVNRNPKLMPGNTWSPHARWTNKPEPMDRIDYIYYKSYNLRPISSRIYEGNEAFPMGSDPASFDWPSDHAAVITDFAYVN